MPLKRCSQMSHARPKKLLHRNAPQYAMSTAGLGRVKTRMHGPHPIGDCASIAGPLLTQIQPSGWLSVALTLSAKGGHRRSPDSISTARDSCTATNQVQV